MRSTGSLVILFMSCQIAAAVAPPKPPTEEERAAIVKKWREAYDEALTKAQDKVADAKLSKSAVALVTANTALNNLKKEPIRSGLGVFTTIRQAETVGQVGMLVQPELTVREVTSDGAVVEGSYEVNRALGGGGTAIATAKETVIVRYLIASPPPNVKPKAKVKLDGLWYVAGTTEVAGKPLPTLYRFEVKKEELPNSK